MKNMMRILVFICFAAVGVCAGDIVVNGGFEDGAVGELPTAWMRNGRISTDKPHSGKQCGVHAANPTNGWNMFDTASANYIPVKTNQTYRLSGFCRNTVPSGTVALGIRLIDAANKTIGYSWRTVNPNVQTWSEYGLDFKTTFNTTAVGVYLKLGEDVQSGEAFWDDISIAETEEVIPWFAGRLNTGGTFYKRGDAFSGNSYFDAVRNTFVDVSAEDVSYTAIFSRNTAGKRYGLTICKRYETNVIVRQKSVLLSGEKEMVLPVPITKLPLGHYLLSAELFDGATVIERSALPLAVVPHPEYPLRIDPIRTSSINDRSVLVNGKPFVGFLFYHPSLTKEHFTSITLNFGENVRQLWSKNGSARAVVKDNIAELRTYLDMCRESGSYGVVVLFHEWIVDRTLNTFRYDALKEVVLALKDHPALLMWDLIDEPDGRRFPADETVRGYEFVKRLDPDHIVWVNLCYNNRFSEYIKSSDIASYDHYPFPAEPLSLLDAWNKQVLDAAGNRKPLLSVLQLWSPGGVRLPTSSELRAEAYLCVTRGMHQFFYYTWSDPPASGQLKKDIVLQGTVKEINAELSSLSPFLVAPNEAVDIPQLNNNAVRYCLRTVAGKNYLLVVNMLDVPLPPYSISLPGFSGGAVEAMFEDGRAIVVKNGRLTDVLEGYGVHLYRY